MSASDWKAASAFLAGVTLMIAVGFLDQELKISSQTCELAQAAGLGAACKPRAEAVSSAAH